MRSLPVAGASSSRFLLPTHRSGSFQLAILDPNRPKSSRRAIRSTGLGKSRYSSLRRTHRSGSFQLAILDPNRPKSSRSTIRSTGLGKSRYSPLRQTHRGGSFQLAIENPLRDEHASSCPVRNHSVEGHASSCPGPHTASRRPSFRPCDPSLSRSLEYFRGSSISSPVSNQSRRSVPLQSDGDVKGLFGNGSKS